MKIPSSVSFLPKISLFTGCLILGILYISPQLQFTFVNLIDVSETVQFKDTKFIPLLADIFTEPVRFRPLYYSRYFLALLFNYQAKYYFLTFGILLGLSLFLFCLMLKKSLSRHLGIALLLLNPVSIDTYWRLGTAENLLVLLLLLSIFLILTKRYHFLIVSLSLLSLTKETAIFFLPDFIWLAAKKKNYKLAIAIFLLLSIDLALLLPRVWYSFQHTTYVSEFLKLNPSLNLTTALEYTAEFWPIVLLLVTSITLFLISKNYRNPDHLFLFLLMLSSTPPVLLFTAVEGYYLFPTLATTLLLLFIQLTKKVSITYRLLVFIPIIISGLFSLHPTVKRAQIWYKDYAGDNALMIWLRQKNDITDTYYVEGRSEYIGAINYIVSEIKYPVQVTILPSVETYWKTLSKGEKKLKFLYLNNRSQFIRNPAKSVYLTEDPNSFSFSPIPLCKRTLLADICKWFIFKTV